jgi:molybdenum cofactor biosynthesis enzyme
LKGDVQEVAKVASPDQRQADWSQYPLVHPIQLRTPHVLHT